ncbi:Predicted membrane protein [Chryseobacterium nakagawai]|uniref:DUF1634 domain-containing protein n=2 Tax=Chryseobacterium nakagawai TaxID=1241982 RepID=A0AAD0YRT9_CHRNA|nr:DUF1634 domain-containing protein [Chryseobacterium nakagawai]VEH21643.1 Predicted membrane protein [Chryseobacterium nakagawai]
MEVTDKTIRNLVGNVLKYGVRSVLCIGIIGGGIFLSNHATEKVDYSHFTEKEENIFKVIGDIFSGAVNLDGSSIIYIGILILFCTPFLRVILSLISFALEKDKLYVGITTVVILIICLSVYFGFGH